MTKELKEALDRELDAGVEWARGSYGDEAVDAILAAAEA